MTRGYGRAALGHRNFCYTLVQGGVLMQRGKVSPCGILQTLVDSNPKCYAAHYVYVLRP
jgi:hypothetical protein